MKNLEFAISQFAICSEPLECSPYGNGHINSTFLLVCDDKGVIKTGAPYVEGVKAKAEVLEHGKEDKLVIFKYKAKKNVHHRQGHRQPYSKLKIVSIG